MYESLLGKSLAGTLRSMSSNSVSKGSSVISSAQCVAAGFPEGEEKGALDLQHYLPKPRGTSQRHRCHQRKTNGLDEMFRSQRPNEFYLQAGRCWHKISRAHDERERRKNDELRPNIWMPK